MTTTTTPTADDLRAQIVEHEAAIVAAERDAGAALRAGTSTSAALKRADQAHGAIKAARAAIEQIEVEATQAAERERQEAASAARLENYEWAAGVAPLIEAVSAAEAAMLAAEERLRAHYQQPGHRKFARVKSGMRETMDESDLCAGVIKAVPLPLPAQRKPEGWSWARWVPADVIRELHELATTRAVEERAGEGRDWSGEPGPGVRERQERRQRERAAVKEQRTRKAAEQAQQRREAIEAGAPRRPSEAPPEHGRAQFAPGHAGEMFGLPVRPPAELTGEAA